MYNCLIKVKFIFIILILFLSIGSNAFCFDLADELYSTFQKHYKGGHSESYLQSPYISTYSKDPFKDSFDDVANMSMQLKISGAEYVENLLKEEGCSLSQKKIWAILYYFVPEFKVDLVRTMKIGLGDYNSRNYVFDEDKILKYCNDYFNCSKSKGMTISEIKDNASDFRRVTSDTAADIKTNCQEFFQEMYARGQDAEGKKQKIQTSHLGTDKYWNATMDDSPYDIMTDLGDIGKLLYTDAEKPITPVFYKLPMFSKSKDSLESHQENGSSYTNKTGENGDSGGGQDGKDANKGNVGGSSVNPLPLPIPRGSEGLSMEGGYDEMVDGLQSYRIKGTSLGNACDDEEDDSDDDTNDDLEEVDSPGLDLLDGISPEEFENVVAYMLGAVDKYAELPDEEKVEIIKRAGDTHRFLGVINPSDLDKTAEEIKDCWQSCEGLRIDQKASCMVMCTCGEIASAIFDPDETPGLGPIFRIRFCAVPAVDTKFAVGGRNIFSIEEGVNEIYGVVDKLSREGRLGMWTQQYNFLDSTTKKMKVADTVAFTISVEFEDISNKFTKQSLQFQKKEMKMMDESWLRSAGVYNDLENPVQKNQYRLIGREGEETNDVTARGNPQGTNQSQTNLGVAASNLVNSDSDSRASHNITKSWLLDKWLDQQGDLWKSIDGYINDLAEDTIGLDSKKDKR